MANKYEVLSLVYDRWQQTFGKDYSQLILPKILATVEQHNIPKGGMLDLACGTGTLALLMARRGWSVVGVDGSMNMIACANRKNEKAKKTCIFLLDDMRTFKLPHPVNLVTSVFDSLNHLTTKNDLKRTFRSVYRALQPDGFFIFDVTNELGFTTVWGSTGVVHLDGFSITFENHYNKKRKAAHSDVTLFLRDGEKFNRLTETVRQRYYPDKEIAGLLKLAGFRVLEREDFDFTPDQQVGEIKTWWVAQRQ